MIRRIPHCSHWGAYSILVDEGKIVGVEPFQHDPAPSSIIHSITEWARPERRVLYPLVREGWLAKRENSDRAGRGKDRFVRVSWDEATALVVSEIRRVSADHGNESIFAGSYGWASCGRFHHPSTLLKRMMNLAGGFTGHVDTYSIAAGPAILRHVLGDARACGGQASTLDTIAEHTETLVVFGAMSPRTAQTEAGGIGAHRLEHYLRDIVARGIKVIHVSPLRDDLPDWVGAEWWPIPPNTDTALILGMAGQIVMSGREDRAFLARCTSGSDQLLAYLRGETDGRVKDADWAASIIGIPAQAIRDLATRLVETRSMLTLSWALQRAHHGEQPYWAALALAALIGQIGLPGGGVGYGYGSLGGMGAPIPVGQSSGLSQLTRPINSFIPVARIADMLLSPGGSYTFEGETRRFPDARLVYWAGGNPFHHHQDLNRLSRAWTRPETIIVQDPMMTATARRADIVLPATTSLERNDLSGNRRSDFVLAMGQAIAPLGQAQSDFDIFNRISESLGVGDAFNEGRDEMAWLRHLYAQSRSHADSEFGFAMPEFDRFWAQGYARCPVQRDHTYLAEFRKDPGRHALNTESGRIVLGSEKLARLQYADCPAHPAWIAPAEWLGNADPGALHLISHQPAGRLHSQLETGKSSLAQKRGGREQIRLNPSDAAVRNIADGQTVRLWNARGACLATARMTDAVCAGVAVLPTGAWFTPQGEGAPELAGNPNVLTLDIGSSQFGQGCSAHTCLVQVDPHEDADGDAVEIYDAQLAGLLPE